MRTSVAFANTAGGTLLIGVEDRPRFRDNIVRDEWKALLYGGRWPDRWGMYVPVLQGAQMFAKELSIGDEVSQTFTGNIWLDDVSITAPGLPNSPHTTLVAGVPVSVPVRITNNGAAVGAFFVDARLYTVTQLSLANLSPPPSSPAGAPILLPVRHRLRSI